jgi:hypothetical protein
MSVLPILEGVIPSVATSLTDASGVNESRLRRLVRFLLRCMDFLQTAPWEALRS